MVDTDRWYREMFEASTVGLALADENGLLVLANDAYAAIVGCPRHLLAGRSSREFTHPDDLAQHAAMEQIMDEAKACGESVHVEKRYLHADGSVRWGWISASEVPGPGGARWTMAVVHDTTDRRRVEDDLRVAAQTDALTGLLNRRGWRDRLHALTTQPEIDATLALAMIDFDRFKSYNDEHGHGRGDRLLVRFSVAAADLLGARASIARWGGEEFALAMPGVGSTTMAAVLTELATVVPDKQTFSAGYATLRAGETVDDCFDRADMLLYRAKFDGGARSYGDDSCPT
ncbi:sensor domain-containing diguanylate cyclase [Rhodococcus sp. 06-235-1A]|uniref:sensor domain-containing diguanylate cyclase n=1 Tax=Rhodococcus sp. 06-235-1A TaxID=2022508 RepID=UPI00117B2CD6|nr:sensor domain-containing diguanylate cyclase [Rhodococcus sp. 06-235-1A]